MNPAPLPAPPPRVSYALTVPQSVLFADLSLRGSRRSVFREVFGRDFAIGWVAIDDGAMSWDHNGDDTFAQALCGTSDVAVAVRRFIAAMSSTSRALEKTGALLGAPDYRREDSIEDVLDDLGEYWDAYERQMTSLFTFWNVEQLLSETLVAGCRASGRDDDVASGLLRFLQPSETNYFALERRHLARLGDRFGPTDGPALEAAVARHVDAFGFLLAPFNLGAPPSIASILERLGERDPSGDGIRQRMLDGRGDQLNDVPEPLRELGLLAQELTFWKTERLDVLSLGDARVAALYRAAAKLLSIELRELFAMRRDELAASLQAGRATVDAETLAERLAGYCLLLDEDEISFREPSRTAPEPTSELHPDASDGTIEGIGASAGIATGRVRVIQTLDDIQRLERGDVLVTTMTRPEMGAGLDRAVAFVTDQGGKMCHAAIISREMGKPCVIGTEVATQRLRDGMQVTVDGGQGIVTILEGDA